MQAMYYYQSASAIPAVNYIQQAGYNMYIPSYIPAQCAGRAEGQGPRHRAEYPEDGEIREEDLQNEEQQQNGDDRRNNPCENEQQPQDVQQPETIPVRNFQMLSKEFYDYKVLASAEINRLKKELGDVQYWRDKYYQKLQAERRDAKKLRAQNQTLQAKYEALKDVMHHYN